MASTKEKVQLYVYDITRGMARQMAPMLIGQPLEGVWHTGVVLFGQEYFFGGGIVQGVPGQCVGMAPTKILDLGETEKTKAELDAWCQSVNDQWTVHTYKLLEHNCNHFSDACCKFLMDKGIPEDIVDLPNRALSTPQGQAIRGMIENMDRQARAQMTGNSMNPFGSVGAGSAAAAPMIPGADYSLENLNEGLQTLEADNSEKEKIAFALHTMIKIVENIINHPGEEKYLKIKMENAAFNKKVAEVNGGTEVIMGIGFSPDEIDGVDHWVMSAEAIPALPRIRMSLKMKAAKYPVAAAPKAAAAPPAGYPGSAAAGSLIGNSAAPQMGNLPPGMASPEMMQQFMGNPQAMQQVNEMMSNPQAMQQAQQMLQNNPQMAAQAQQMMQDPAAMERMMRQFGQNPPR